MQGGPHDHINAAKAIAYGEALKPEFVEYSKNVIANARALAAALQEKGYRIISGGTDNHLMLVDVFGSRTSPARKRRRRLRKWASPSTKI